MSERVWARGSLHGYLQVLRLRKGLLWSLSEAHSWEAVLQELSQGEAP